MQDVYIYSQYGFTLWDPRSLQCLLQYEIVKSGFNSSWQL